MSHCRRPDSPRRHARTQRIASCRVGGGRALSRSQTDRVPLFAEDGNAAPRESLRRRDRCRFRGYRDPLTCRWLERRVRPRPDAHTVVARNCPAALGPPKHFSSVPPAAARSRNSLWSIPRAGKSVLDNRIVSASQYDARDLLRGCHRVRLLRIARDGARQITYYPSRTENGLVSRSRPAGIFQRGLRGGRFVRSGAELSDSLIINCGVCSLTFPIKSPENCVYSATNEFTYSPHWGSAGRSRPWPGE